MMGKKLKSQQKEEKIKIRFIHGENLTFGLEPITLWVGCVCVGGGGEGGCVHSNQLQVKYKATGGW